MSYYKFLYLLYKCLRHYDKHYKEITVCIDNGEDNNKNENSTYDKQSIIHICERYYKKYALSPDTITHLITGDYQAIYTSIQSLLHIDTFHSMIHTHILSQYIEKI